MEADYGPADELIKVPGRRIVDERELVTVFSRAAVSECDDRLCDEACPFCRVIYVHKGEGNHV